MEGDGIFVFEDGSTYQGQFKDGQYHGIGTFLSVNNREKYVGSWKSNKREGHGELRYADKSTYVGNWKNDLKHGNGTFYNPDRTFYCGDYKNG